MTTAHTYIRCVNKIYVGDAADQWRELHNFETEKRAKRWQQDQEKQRPGSVTVGPAPPNVTRAKIDSLKADYEQRRRVEIRKLVQDQARDQARHSPTSRYNSGPSGKTAKLARAAVAPDHDGSSFLRKRSKKQVISRNARNTRATYGGS